MGHYFREGRLDMIGDGLDLLFCNRDEAMGFPGTHSLYRAAQALQDYCRTFAITCGADGALVFDGELSYFVESPSVKAVDTNGPGDMFAGAFLWGIPHRHDYETAGRFANLA